MYIPRTYICKKNTSRIWRTSSRNGQTTDRKSKHCFESSVWACKATSSSAQRRRASDCPFHTARLIPADLLAPDPACAAFLAAVSFSASYDSCRWLFAEHVRLYALAMSVSMFSMQETSGKLSPAGSNSPFGPPSATAMALITPSTTYMAERLHRFVWMPSAKLGPPPPVRWSG